MSERYDYAEAGRRGAAKRWGAPRVVRLDGLSESQRRVIADFIRRVRADNARASE